MRTSPAVFCSLLLLSMTLSGCVSQDEGLPGGTTGEGSVDEVFEGLDYIECMNHEEMERCWNVFVPKTVNLSADVPLVLDIHGNTLTMENQRDLSQFDDIAEENGVVLFGRRATTTRGTPAIAAAPPVKCSSTTPA